MDFNENMNQLAAQFEKNQMGDRLKDVFSQTMHKMSENRMGNPYEQQTSQIFSKNMLAKGFGASVAGTIGGFASRFIPINIGINGAPIVLGSWALQKFVFKTAGIGRDLAEGAMIAGLGIAFAGLTSGGLGFLNIGGVTTGAPAQSPPVSENVNF